MNNLNNLVNDNEKNIHRQDIQRKYIKRRPLLLSEPASGSTNISKQLKYYRDNEYHEVDTEDNDADNNTVTSSSINVENISNRIDSLENKISSSKHSELVDDTPNMSVKSSLIKESSTDVQKALYKKSKTKYIENIVKPLALKSDMIKKEIQYFIYKSIKNNKYKTRIAAGISRLRKNEIRIAKIRYKDEIKDGLLKSDILKSIDVDIKNTISPQQAASVKLSKLEKQVAIVDKPANDTSDLFSYMKKLENRVELLESESPDDTESSNTKNIEKDNTLDTLDKNLLDIKAFFGLDKSKVSTLAASGRIQDIDNNIIQVTKNTEEIKRELLLLSKPKKVVSDITVAKDRDFDKPKDLEKREKDKGKGNVGSTGGLLDGIMSMLSKIVGGALLSGLARKFLKAIMPGGKDKAPKAGKKMPGGVDVPDAKNKKPSFMDKLKNSKVVGGLAKAGRLVAKAGKLAMNPYVAAALLAVDTALTYNDAFGISSVKDFSVGKTVSSLVGSVVGTLELIGIKDAGVDSARWFQKHVGSVIDSGISKISGSDGEEKLNNVIEAKEIEERKESFAKEVQALKSTANKNKNKEMSKEDKVSFGFDLLIALSKSEAIKIEIKTELLPNEVIAANNFAFTGGEFITEETDPTNILENYFITSIAPNRLEQLDQQLANLDKDSLDSLFLVVVKDEKTKNRVLKDTPARYDMKDIINARLQGKSVKTLKLTSIPEPSSTKTTASSMYEKVKSAAATTGSFIGTAAKSAGKFVSATASSITSAVSNMTVKDTVKSVKSKASSIFPGISSAATATTDALKSAANTVSKVTGTAFMTSDVKAKVLDIATKGTGLSVAEIEKILHQESGGNPREKTGKYLGLFQIGPEAAKSVGMEYGDKLYDPVYNATAFAKYNAKAKPALLAANIPITLASNYMLHQQGPGGFPTLWKIAATGKIPSGNKYDLPNNMANNVIGRKKGQKIFMSARQFLAEWYNSKGETLPIPNNVGGYSNVPLTPDLWESHGNSLGPDSRGDRKGSADTRAAKHRNPAPIQQQAQVQTQTQPTQPVKVAKAPVPAKQVKESKISSPVEASQINNTNIANNQEVQNQTNAPTQPVKVAKAQAVAKPLKESKISSPVEASQINNTNIASNQEVQRQTNAPTARANINSNNQSQSNDVKQTVLQMDKFGVESTFDKSASVNMNKGV